MRIIALMLMGLGILLSSCQSTRMNPEVSSKKGRTRPSSSKIEHSIYDRYKNRGNRYTILQDAPPAGPHTVSFKEPVPTKEPLSRYGNPVEYHVDGQKYQVLKSASGYKTRGIASWYGTKFNKHRTSSGEPYNMYVMTAAHKTLPLPSYISVKNLDNGRVAVVKVNDRGPFHSNRVLDVSYAAALKLGIFPKGTARVEIETLMGPAGQAHYYLQAGAFSSEPPAKKLKEKVIHLSTSPVFVEHYKQYYVVRAGPFANKNMVDQLKKLLSRNGVNGSFSVLI